MRRHPDLFLFLGLFLGVVLCEEGLTARRNTTEKDASAALFVQDFSCMASQRRFHMSGTCQSSHWRAGWSIPGLGGVASMLLDVQISREIAYWGLRPRRPHWKQEGLREGVLKTKHEVSCGEMASEVVWEGCGRCGYAEYGIPVDKKPFGVPH
jgi:hypothetical protein